jgi:hypothetical protein
MRGAWYQLLTTLRIQSGFKNRDKVAEVAQSRFNTVS